MLPVEERDWSIHQSADPLNISFYEKHGGLSLTPDREIAVFKFPVHTDIHSQQSF